MTTPIEQIDRNFAVKDAEKNVLWYDAKNLNVEGKGWCDTERFYDRLPARANGKVSEHVWTLSHHSTGLCVRFVTDAASISVRWKLLTRMLSMNHMPATGVSSVDLYVLAEGRWKWAGIGISSEASPCSATLVGGLPPGTRHFMLYLPLYNGVDSIEIGLAPDATLAKGPALPSWNPPLCFYGTSIVQGGCASRPGMVHTAILGRRFQRSVINLGFSGNGTMELPMAHLLAEIDVAAYVVDCVPNMSAELVTERAVPFVEIVRAARPRTPIVLMENITYQNSHLFPTPNDAQRKNRALRAAFDKLTSAGIRKLHYLPTDHLYGNDWEASVDGCHATDLGFMRMADALDPVLRSVLP